MVEVKGSMLGVLSKYFQDTSVLAFCSCFLSPELPMYWGVVLEFTTAGKIQKTSITPDQVKAIVQALNSAAFETI